MPTVTDYVSPLNWGTSTGGAAGAAETTSTLYTDRVDTRIPPDNFTISALQISRMRQLLVSMSAFYKGGTRLQVLAQSSNPFGAGEAGFWSDGTNAKFTNTAGSVTTLGAGGGGGTLATTYSGGSSQTDQTMLMVAAKGYPLIKDNATPIGTLFEIQTSAAASLWKFDATNFTVGANMNFTVTAGTTAVDFSNGTGIFKTTTGTNTLSGNVSLASGKTFTYVGGASTFDASASSGVFKTTTGAHTFGSASWAVPANLVVTGGSASTNTTGNTFTSNVADGATSIGTVINNATTLSNATSKIISFQNNGTEKVHIRGDGSIDFQTNTQFLRVGNTLYWTAGSTQDRIQDSGNTLEMVVGNIPIFMVNTSRAIFQSGVQYQTVSKTANYTLDSSTQKDIYVFADTSGGAFTLTLPAPATAGSGRTYIVIDKGAAFNTNNLTLARNSTETINGTAGNKALTIARGIYFITTDGTNWFVNVGSTTL